MSNFIEAKDVGAQSLFALENGSIYVMVGRGPVTGVRQARLWCAHPPDSVTPEPPLVDFPPEQQVRLVEANETREHYHHEGYIAHVFAREMDRRHQAAMRPANERMQREADELFNRSHRLRTWWNKVVG